MQCGYRLATTATKWKLTVERADAVLTTQCTTNQLGQWSSLPNCKEMWGKFNTMGVGRILWQAVAKERTMMLTIKITGFLRLALESPLVVDELPSGRLSVTIPANTTSFILALLAPLNFS
jgi:hypothetical protein